MRGRTPRSQRPLPVLPVNEGSRPAVGVALIVCAGALTYWNSLDTPFIWDDSTAILENPSIRSLWPLWEPLAPPLDTPVSRRPLVNLSFALNYAIHALDVTGYHLTNLGVHLLAACLLFSVVRRAFSSVPLRARFGQYAFTVALLAALWWALHPMLSEVVNYATQRTTAMAGLFFFATLYAAQRALAARHRRRWQAAAVVSCALGMLAKESLATVPIVVVLYDRAFAFGSFREALAARKWLYGALAITWIELAALIALRPHTTIGFSTDVGVWTYALNQAQMIPHYLRLALWPDALVLDYGLPRPLALPDVLGRALLVMTLLGITIAALVRWPKVGFLGAVFFLTLAPASSIVPIATEVGAERRMYLPLAALAVLGALGGLWLVQRARALAPPGSQRLVARTALVAAGVWIAMLAVRTVDRNDDFSSREAIWRSSVEQRPHGRARLSYATALLDAGHEESALRQLQLAVRDYPKARFALANELAGNGHYEEALRELSAFIRANPRQVDTIPARRLRGRILAEEGRHDEAIAEFRALVELFPSTIAGRESLADLLLVEGRGDEAASQYRVLLNRRPDHAPWLIKLGDAFAAGRRVEDAAHAYTRALNADARSGEAHVRLAGLLVNAGRTAEAAEHARAAIALDSRDAAAHNLLGIARAMDGRLDEAAAHFETALEIAPDYPDARENLARAQRARRSAPLPSVQGRKAS